MTKAHRKTDKESATPRDQGPLMDATGHYVPKDIFDLNSSQYEAAMEALAATKLLLPSHHVDTASFKRFAKDLNIFLKSFKDVNYEFNNIQTERDGADDLKRIANDSNDLFEFTRKMYEDVSDKLGQAHRIAETRRLAALEWARQTWPEARSNETGLSTMGLSNLTVGELEALYYATRHIISFQKRFGFSESELVDFFRMGDNLRTINRAYDEETRREVKAMELLKLFRSYD